MFTICQHLNTLCGEERRRIERMMRVCFTWFHIGDLGEPNIYHDSGGVTRMRGFYLVVFLVGVRFRGGYGFIFPPFTYFLKMFPYLLYSVPFHFSPLFQLPTYFPPSGEVIVP